MTRLFGFIGFTAAILTALCGCVTKQVGNEDPGAADDSSVELQAAGPATQPVPQTQPLTSPEALAWTTAAYTQALEPHIHERGRPPVAATQPRGAERAVQRGGPESADSPAVSTADVQIGPARGAGAAVNGRVPPATQPLSVASETAPAPPSSRPAAAELQGGLSSLDPLEVRLARQVQEQPGDAVAQLEWQIFQWLSGKPAPQLAALAHLPAEDREVVYAVVDALANFRNNARNQGKLLLTEKLRPLTELSDRLRAQGGLWVGSVTLCRSVRGFGVYEPIEADRLPSGKSVVAIVYCQIENFSSRLSDRGLWETDLLQEVILYNEQGQRVHMEKRQAVRDQARNRRRDFFLAREIRLPGHLPPGQYTLTVSVCDQQANRLAEASMPLRIVSPSDRSIVEQGHNDLARSP